MPRCISVFVCLVVVAAVGFGRFAAAGVTYRVVAITGQDAPGTDVEFFGGGVPAINPSGQVVFRNSLRGVGIDTSNRVGVWAGAQDALESVARKGSPAPGTGTVFSDDLDPKETTFDQPVINAAGAAAFFARLDPRTNSATSDEGLWAGMPGAIELVAREGEPTPIPNVRYGTLEDNFAVLNDAGELAFKAKLANVPSSADSAVFAGTPGSLQLVAREGSAFKDLGNARPVLNGSGKVAFRGEFVTGPYSPDDGIWMGAPGALQSVAKAGDPTGDLPGNTFSELSAPSINDADQVAFRANFYGAGTDNSNNTGIFLGTADSVSLVAREGDAAPETDAAYGFGFSTSLLPDVSLNGGGELLFAAPLTGESVTADNNEALFAGPADAIRLVAREGAQAPGAEPGARFRIFHERVLNGNGRVAFSALLTNGHKGIWATTDEGGLIPVALKGQEISVGEGAVRTFEALILLDNIYSGGEDGLAAGINDADEIGFHAIFSDGTAAVLVATVPEPPTAVLLLAGLVPLAAYWWGIRRPAAP